jgi:hypothetical protein
MESYPLISNSNKDPLFVLKKYFTENELKTISSKILEELELELL